MKLNVLQMRCAVGSLYEVSLLWCELWGGEGEWVLSMNLNVSQARYCVDALKSGIST